MLTYFLFIFRLCFSVVETPYREHALAPANGRRVHTQIDAGTAEWLFVIGQCIGVVIRSSMCSLDPWPRSVTQCRYDTIMVRSSVCITSPNLSRLDFIIMVFISYGILIIYYGHECDFMFIIAKFMIHTLRIHTLSSNGKENNLIWKEKSFNTLR